MAKKIGTMKKGQTSVSRTHGSSILSIVKMKVEEKQNYTIRINKKVGEEFRKMCKKNKVSMSDMVEEFFKKELGGTHL